MSFKQMNEKIVIITNEWIDNNKKMNENIEKIIRNDVLVIITNEWKDNKKKIKKR